MAANSSRFAGVTRIALALAFLGAAGAGAVLVATYSSTPTRAAEGTRLGGVDVGGLTRDQIVQRLTEEASRSPAQVMLRMGAVTLPLGYDRLGAQVDVRASADRALEQSGRDFAGLLSLGGGRKVTPVVRVDRGLLATRVATATQASRRPASVGDLTWTGSRFAPVAPRAGQTATADAVRVALLTALQTLPAATGVTVPVEEEPAPVDAAQVAALADRATREIRSLTLRAAAAPATAREVVLPADELAPLLTIDVAGGLAEIGLRAQASRPVLAGLAVRLSVRPNEPRITTPAGPAGTAVCRGRRTLESPASRCESGSDRQQRAAGHPGRTPGSSRDSAQPRAARHRPFGARRFRGAYR